MNEPFPITVEMVVEAYAVLGAKPIQGDWFDQHFNCGCGLGVVIAANHSREVADQLTNFSRVAHLIGATVEEVMDFAGGFDGIKRYSESPVFELGRRSAQAVGLIPPDDQ